MGVKLPALFLLLAAYALTTAQTSAKVKTGRLTVALLSTHGEFKQWFLKEYNSNQPNAQSIAAIKAALQKKPFTVQIIMGTWCTDSQREVPRLVKVLKAAGLTEKQFFITGVSRNKKVPNRLKLCCSVTNVPTAIFFNSAGKETGRIVETPAKTWEEDIAALLSR